MTADPRPRLTVGMPAFNEIGNVEVVVRDLLGALRPSGITFELIVVDDGSTDGTEALIDRLATEIPELRVAHHERNRGVGAAWRTVAGSARGEWVFLQPADGQLSASEASRFYGARGDAELLIGLRRPWPRPLHRRVLSVGFRLATRVLLGVRPEGDFGVCFLFRGDLLRSFRAVSGDRGIAILVEWIFLARRAGARISSLPADVLPRLSGSSKTARLDDTLATMLHVVRAAVYHRVLRRTRAGRARAAA